MKVSEKSLELNVGSELIGMLRRRGLRKAYLRGLTQREERQEGVDFFVHLDLRTRIFAFQFKAPRGTSENIPYRYTISDYQHALLFALAQTAPNSVFYVFPFYVTPAKLHGDLPFLRRDTWLLSVAQMIPAQVFGSSHTKIIRCQPGMAAINPEFTLQQLSDISRSNLGGVPAREFALWYTRYREALGEVEWQRNPWLVRGLRIAIVPPSTAMH